MASRQTRRYLKVNAESLEVEMQDARGTDGAGVSRQGCSEPLLHVTHSLHVHACLPGCRIQGRRILSLPCWRTSMVDHTTERAMESALSGATGTGCEYTNRLARAQSSPPCPGSTCYLTRRMAAPLQAVCRIGR